MEKNIEVKGEIYIIKGTWEPQGVSFIFNGSVERLETNQAILTIDFKVPFSAIRKYGQETMEEEIAISVREHLERKHNKAI